MLFTCEWFHAPDFHRETLWDDFACILLDNFDSIYKVLINSWFNVPVTQMSIFKLFIIFEVKFEGAGVVAAPTFKKFLPQTRIVEVTSTSWVFEKPSTGLLIIVR